MKKDSVRIKNGKGDWEGKKLTIGMDLGDRTSRYCVLGEGGEVLLEASVATTQKGLSEAFGALPPCRIAIDVSPGDNLQITATLQAYQNSHKTKHVTIALHIPASAGPGSGTVQVGGRPWAIASKITFGSPSWSPLGSLRHGSAHPPALRLRDRVR